MEAILIGAFILKYDTIESTIRNLEPFLNIERKSGYFYYRMIIILKTVYVLYAMENAVPILSTLIFKVFSKMYLAYMRPVLALSAYLTLCLHIFGTYFPQMALVGMLAISCKSYEFLLDIYVLLCSLYYATHTYKREIDKLITIICFSLGIGSYINNIESSEPFRFGVYYLLVVLCLATVFPLLPNRNKYGHRLIFYYMVLISWIIYKGHLHCTNGSLSTLQPVNKSDVCNITQRSLNEIWVSREKVFMKSLHVDDVLDYGSLKNFDLKVKNCTEVMNEEGCNVKEMLRENYSDPDIICHMEVDGIEENIKENREKEIKEKTDETSNVKVEHTETENEEKSVCGIYNPFQYFNYENVPEEDPTNFRQEQIAEDIDHLGDTQLKDTNSDEPLKMEREISLKMSETNPYPDDMEDQRDTTEIYPVTETSLDSDENNVFKNRMGNVEIIDNGISHKFVYKAPDFTETSEEPEQHRSQNEEFVVVKHTVEAIKSEETLINVLDYDSLNKDDAVEMIEPHTTDVEVEIMPKANEAREVVGLNQLTERVINKYETRLKTDIQTAQINEAKEIGPKSIIVGEKDFTNIGSPQENKYNPTMDVDLKVRDSEYKKSRNFVENESTDKKREEVNSQPQTIATSDPEDNAGKVADIKKIKTVYASDNSFILPEEVTNDQTAVYKATVSHFSGTAVAVAKTDIKETKVQATSTSVLSEMEHEMPESVLTEAFTAEIEKSKVPETRVLEPTKSRNFVASKFCSNQISENESIFPHGENRDNTASDYDYTESIVSEVTEAREKEFSLAKYPPASDYETCKPISYPANNREISTASASKLECVKNRKSKSIQLQPPLKTVKIRGLKFEKDLHSNKASESGGIGYKATEVSDAKVSEHQTIDPGSKIESKVNRFQSKGLKLVGPPSKFRKIAYPRANEFDLFKASNVRANENKFVNEQGKLIQQKIEIGHPEEEKVTKFKAYKRKRIDTSEFEETLSENEVEVVILGLPAVRKIGYQVTDTKRDEFSGIKREKSEMKRGYTRTELLNSESGETPVKAFNLKKTEDAKSGKAKTIVNIKRSKKTLPKGNVPVNFADVASTKIQGIDAVDTENTMHRMSDSYEM